MSTAIHLASPEVRQRLALEAQEPGPPHAARRVLEEALTAQCRALADSLLAGRLLAGETIPLSLWWQHYRASNDGIPASPDSANSGFREFRRLFARRLAQGSIRPLSAHDLSRVVLSTYDPVTWLWNDVRINQQLAHLGSSLRVSVLGAHELTVNRIFSIVGSSDHALPLDARFILGNVGPCTASPYGELYDFVDELAVSPYLDPGAPGFTYRETIVMRRKVFAAFGIGTVTPDAPRSSVACYYSLQWLSTFVHETVHIAPLVIRSEGAFLRSAWREFLETDICRHCQVALPRADLDALLFPQYDLSAVEEADKTLKTSYALTLRHHMPDLSSVLEHMMSQGKIVGASEGNIYSPLSEESRRWHP